MSAGNVFSLREVGGWKGASLVADDLSLGVSVELLLRLLEELPVLAVVVTVGKG